MHGVQGPVLALPLRNDSKIEDSQAGPSTSSKRPRKLSPKFQKLADLPSSDDDDDSTAANRRADRTRYRQSRRNRLKKSLQRENEALQPLQNPEEIVEGELQIDDPSQQPLQQPQQPPLKDPNNPLVSVYG